MTLRKDNYKFIVVFVFFILAVFFISYIYIFSKEKILLDEKYNLLTKNIKKSTQTLIYNKKNATMALTIALSKDYMIINAFEKNDFTKLDFPKLSQELKSNTNYQNVWIHIIDKNGISKYKSWTDKKDENLLSKRSNLSNILKYKRASKTIVAGTYGFCFKSTVPIFKDGEFLGLIETITKFNSIARSLKNINTIGIVLANKDAKEIITKPFTNIFIDEYYVATKNTSPKLLKKISKEGVNSFLQVKNYRLDDKYLISSMDLEGNKGHVIFLKNLEDIDVSSIYEFKKQAFILLFIVLFLLIFIIITYSYQAHTKNIKRMNKRLNKSIEKLKFQKNKTQQLLDSQSNIIIITDGEEIVNANQQLLNFFTDCETLDIFKEKYICICTAFIDYNEKENYLIEKDYDGNNWAEHIMANPNQPFKAAIYDMNKKLHHYALNVSQHDEESLIIVTLTDISYDMKIQEDLKHFNANLENLVDEKTNELKVLNENLEQKIKDEIKISKDKDRVIFQQNKMASIAQMLHNIAHQWRQPLSVISSASSGMLIQKELGVLDDELFEENCKIIVDKSKYLSNTIEGFRTFFSSDKEQKFLKVKTVIHDICDYIDILLKDENINLILELDNDLDIKCYENEFKQAILNILENSIKAFKDNKKKDDRVIIIKLVDSKLTIVDSANGIDEKILDKIFEPYFTTKHQAQGVGMGLYMVQELLSNHMNFKVKVKNTSFEYENKKQKGLCVSIDLK